MQRDPAYQGAIPDRTAGLSAWLLHAFHLPGGDPEEPFTIEQSGGDEVFVVALVRHGQADTAGQAPACGTPVRKWC